MALHKNDSDKAACPRTGKQIGSRARNRYWWVNWLFPVVGLVSLIWFLVRVIPKPMRAAYPCQRVAGGLAGGFLVWIAGTVGSVFAFRRGKQLFVHSRLGKALLCFVIAAVAGIIALERMPEKMVGATPSAPENRPLGVAQGIHPGRVVWVHDPNVSDWTFPGAQTYGGYPGTWNGETDMVAGSAYGYWYEHTAQAVVDQMVSSAIQGVAGESTDSGAWNAIFVNLNEERGKGSVGYQSGEKFMIKVNYANTNRVDSAMSFPSGDQTTRKGWIVTSPQIIISVLDQLVNVVGVAESNITVGDTTAYLPNHLYSILSAAFPNVRYLDAGSGLTGRVTVTTSAGTGWDAPIDWSTPVADSRYEQDYLSLSYAQAEYLINLAVLKAHATGITVCGKNHFGSLIRLPDPCYMGDGSYYRLHHGIPGPAPWYSPGLGFWRPQVDLMGHSHLGEKTVLYLIDGLYGGYNWEGRPYRWNMTPFNGGWPCSVFASQDPVAIDSVAYDFLLTEWPDTVTGGVWAPGTLLGGAEDYLHEAALADDPCSGETYHPDPCSGPLSASLGVHEHWNNATDKQYTRNLETGDGIELYIPGVSSDPALPDQGDITGDGRVDKDDLIALMIDWLGCTDPSVAGCTQVVVPPDPCGMPTIPRGTAVVDGYLDEWTGATWTYLDAIYYLDPCDVPEARFTARWDEASSTIYVAVVVTDNDDYRTDGFAGSWDAGDRIEILSVGDAEVATGWESRHDVGQEYVVGVTTTGGKWAAWGTGEDLDIYSPDPCLHYAARMVGNQYIYEAQVVQYDNYGAFPSATGATVITALSVGHIVRFDVIANTRHAAGFGMKAVDSNGGRFTNSGLIVERMLVEAGTCGDWGYLAADLDSSCYVDLGDWDILSANWDPITGVVVEGAALVEVYSGAVFYEGPSWDPVTGKLYFCAYSSPYTVLRLDGVGVATVWMTNSDFVNGTFIANDGRMITAEVTGHKVMSYQIGPSGPVDPQQLAYNASWHQPNDLCQTTRGDIYFSDPDWGSQTTSAVYRRDPAGVVTTVVSDMGTTNGVITSPDDTVLYVVDSIAKVLRQYPINPADGTVGAGSLFYDFSGETGIGDPDGLTVDEFGNVYMAGIGGVWVITPAGALEEFIAVPQTASNVTFGGADNKTLFITCDGKVYSLAMQVAGGRVGGGGASLTVNWTSASQSGLENVGTMTITAQLSATSGSDVTVPFTLSGTATEGGGADYTITTSPIVITAGNTTADVTITVNNDILEESNETVVVTMGAPTNANKGATDVHTATITDNDTPPTVNWTSASQSGFENVGTMTITAALSASSDLDVTVPFSLGGTATEGAGEDYTITASPVLITSGNTVGDITITVNDDPCEESSETVIVTMGTPTNANKGGTDVHTVTIMDNDGASEPIALLGSWGSGDSHAEEAGTSRVLVFFAHCEDDDGPLAINSVTWGGQAMTKVIEQNTAAAGFLGYVGSFILDEAGIGSASGSGFVVDWENTNEPFETPSFAHAFFSNVDQADLTGASAGNYNTVTDTISTSSLATSNGDMVLLGAQCGNSGSYACNNGFTKGIETAPSSADGVTGYKPATGANETPSVTYTSTANRQTIIGYVLNGN